MKDGQLLSDRAKHRLRLAAKFMRRTGCKFDSGNFYWMVIEAIGKLNEQERRWLQGCVDWLEEYELAEIKHWGGRHGRSRAHKSKTLLGKKRGVRLPAQNKNLA